jgi:F-type H+-transporting ATPase subunit delta
MSKEIATKRYALALFQIAKEQNLLDQFEDELRAVKKVFEENTDLRKVFMNPKVDLSKKKAIVQEAFASLSTYVKNTLLLLLDRHRENIVADMADEFIQLANETRGVAEAKVYSVRPLTDDEIRALSEAFAKKVGKESLRIENIIDQTLIGGVKLRIGNRIFDGSVRGKLERLERELIANRS